MFYSRKISRLAVALAAVLGDDLSKVKQVQDGKWVVVWPKEFAAPGARLLPP
jgi:hypothetical protein